MKPFLPLLTLLLAPALGAAQSYVVDFEDFNLNGGLFLDVSETLALNDVGGSGIDVLILGNADNRIYDLVQFGHYAFASPQALIDMNWTNYQNPAGTDILFSSSVSSVSLIAGDFGGDNDSPITITAYDAAGNVVDTDTTLWDGFPPFQLLSVVGSGIVRVHYFSGGQYTNSTFFDDITFTPDGPILSVTGLIAGATATLSMSNATPGGQVFLGYSLAGPGPGNVYLGGCGVLTTQLTNPILLAQGTADANGNYLYSGLVPATASGVSIWFHAADLASCQTTNGLAEVIL
jgi:hypothetical protein